MVSSTALINLLCSIASEYPVQRVGYVINVDVVVIGAGVAGLSAAAGISQSAES